MWIFEGWDSQAVYGVSFIVMVDGREHCYRGHSGAAAKRVLSNAGTHCDRTKHWKTKSSDGCASAPCGSMQDTSQQCECELYRQLSSLTKSNLRAVQYGLGLRRNFRLVFRVFFRCTRAC